MSDVLDLPFDQFQRYELVRALLQSVRAPSETFSILDVGGRTALLRDFLPEDQIQLVDVDPSEVEGLVLGSGAQLPFRDDSVDVVAAFDTLEHVPPPLRDAFVAECGRVARRYVILAGPYQSERVAEAEEILKDFLQDRLQWSHRYLQEHRDYGLPDAETAKGILAQAGGKVELLGHGDLERWLLLMCLELYAEHEPTLRPIAKRAYRLYNEHLFRSDHSDDVYRHALVATFGDAPTPHLRDALDPRGSAPAGATAVFRELGQELLRYDALRDSFEPEMARLHGVVQGIEKDRNEHAEALSTQTRDLEESKKTIAALQTDLDRSLSSVAELTSGLEREREESGSVIASYVANLEAHQAELANLQEMRAAELAELDARGQLLQQANEQLAAQNESIGACHLRLQQALEKVVDPIHLREAVVEEGEGPVRPPLRSDLAARLLEATTTAERHGILEGEELSLEEELSVLVQLRNIRARERADLLQERADLTQERDGALDFAARINATLWVRIGKKLGLIPRE